MAGAQNHERAAAAFLTAAHPVAGDRAFVGKSIDQVMADELGQDTPLAISRTGHRAFQ